jgi:hypothetical protein
MRVYSLTESERANTGFSHCIRIAYSPNPADNDFNVAATTALLNAIPLAAGDVVNYPLAQVITKTTPAGAGLSAPTVSVGVTGTPAQLVASGAATAGRSRPAITVDALAGGPFESDGAAKFLTVTLGSTGNLSLATAGEILVFVNVARASDLLKIQA